MKRKLLLVSVLLTLSLGCFFVCKVVAQRAINVDIPPLTGDFDKINRCRCRSGGCYGGNAISFRSICAKSSEPLNCTEFAKNCPQRD